MSPKDDQSKVGICCHGNQVGALLTFNYLVKICHKLRTQTQTMIYVNIFVVDIDILQVNLLSKLLGLCVFKDSACTTLLQIPKIKTPKSLCGKLFQSLAKYYLYLVTVSAKLASLPPLSLWCTSGGVSPGRVALWSVGQVPVWSITVWICPLLL